MINIMKRNIKKGIVALFIFVLCILALIYGLFWAMGIDLQYGPYIGLSIIIFGCLYLVFSDIRDDIKDEIETFKKYFKKNNNT